jgi:hypothetical protein
MKGGQRGVEIFQWISVIQSQLESRSNVFHIQQASVSKATEVSAKEYDKSRKDSLGETS